MGSKHFHVLISQFHFRVPLLLIALVKIKIMRTVAWLNHTHEGWQAPYTKPVAHEHRHQIFTWEAASRAFVPKQSPAYPIRNHLIHMQTLTAPVSIQSYS